MLRQREIECYFSTWASDNLLFSLSRWVSVYAVLYINWDQNSLCTSQSWIDYWEISKSCIKQPLPMRNGFIIFKTFILKTQAVWTIFCLLISMVQKEVVWHMSQKKMVKQFRSRSEGGDSGLLAGLVSEPYAPQPVALWGWPPLRVDVKMKWAHVGEMGYVQGDVTRDPRKHLVSTCWGSQNQSEGLKRLDQTQDDAMYMLRRLH